MDRPKKMKRDVIPGVLSQHSRDLHFLLFASVYVNKRVTTSYYVTELNQYLLYLSSYLDCMHKYLLGTVS